VKFLMSPAAEQNGVVITFVGGSMVPRPFQEMLDPATKKMRTRNVDISGENYEVARRYMIRLEQGDFDDPARLERLAAVVKMTPADFRKRFEYIVK
jgi:6-phosphofructokinase 1